MSRGFKNNKRLIVVPQFFSYIELPNGKDTTEDTELIVYWESEVLATFYQPK